MFEHETHEFTWHSGHLAIRIEVVHTPEWCIMEHLGITSLEPPRAVLPITGTGYLSHFVPQGTIAQHGGPVAYVRRMLDEAASLPEWRKHLADSRQGSLF